MALSVENLHKRGASTALTTKLIKAGLDTVEACYKTGSEGLLSTITQAELKELSDAMKKYNFPLQEVKVKKEGK